ncbi:MAG TPA: Rieske (2Fe-2S) protein [Pyrinomonadaceae bacterium]|nr:Rieske (2Fe-2S) protein [Pyrinomonadaceae bacterium]
MQAFEEKKDCRKEKESVQDRRTFLSIIPLGILGAIAASLGIASKRVLEPKAIAATVGETASENWKTLGLLSDFSGEEPIAKTVAVETNAGWSKTVEDVTYFVLPKHENKVISSVCPHEGCPINWDKETNKFLCPCHDSYFSEKGEKLTGPSKTDLTELETRVADGKLQIKL